MNGAVRADCRDRVFSMASWLMILCALVCALVCAQPATAQSLHADAIVTGARIWTGEASQPYAEAMAVRGERIVAVGTAAELETLAGPNTERLRFDGAFIVPGFIDNHTHFERAGELLLGVNLLAVSSDTAFVRAIRDASRRMPAGAWLTGGEWGAYEAWAEGSAGDERADVGTSSEEWSPTRALIDSITPNSPVLVNRWDRSQYLANGVALAQAQATCAWPGVECIDGVATGRLTAEAAARVRRAIPPKSLEQRMAEARAALADLASHGVTTIHDITSAEQLRVYQELKARGELTVRVYARPTLDKWDELRAVGIRHGFGDEWIRIGGLKGFVDGIMGNSTARFYEPQLHSGERGEWRTMMTEPPGMLPLLIGADSSGHWPQVHAIGDEAIDTLLTMFEEVMRVNGPRERRFRLIHTQVMRDSTVAARMARLGIIAEVQPFHAIDDMRWMEERIGARSRWAYAFRTLKDAGVMLSFGSDWPGTNAAWYPAEPLLGIYAAVTRQTLDGEPAGGWYPQERIDVETALRAYTVNNAWAADEDAIKGSIAVGKLADFVVLDSSPFDVAPAEIKDIRVLRTFVGGRAVYEELQGQSRAETQAEAQVVSEAIRFRLESLGHSARRIVLDIEAAEDPLAPATARRVAQLLGGTVGDLSELMTCSEEPTWGPHVTLRDCTLPIGTMVFKTKRPTMQGDTAVATVSTYMTYPDVPYVSLDSLKLQLAREADGWRVTKVLMMAAS